MSNCSGKVIFKDGTVRHSEYYGTSDIMCPLSYKTREEMNDNWRKWPEEPECKHENIEEVELYSSYGNGFSWEGKCCKDCGWIAEGTNPYKEDEYEDALSWFGMK